MRKILAFVFAFTLLCSQVVYAFPATSGNASYYTATSGNADYLDDDRLLTDTYSSIMKINNTVNRSSVRAVLEYYDMSGVIHHLYHTVDSSGYFKMQRPSDFASLNGISFVILQKGLPYSGKYRMQVDFATNFGIQWNNHGNIWMNRQDPNISHEATVTPFTLSQSSGDFYFSTTLEFGSLDGLSFIVTTPDLFSFPFDGKIDIQLDRLQSNAQVDGVSPGAGSASQDIQQDIQNSTSQMADNTSQLVAGQNEIVQSLKDIVQTISYQLEAFWLQLAHEFTNLYNKMNEQHAEIMQAIQDGLNVTINNQFDELIENDNKNHQEQIQNDNQNTDKITNGYDNSSLNQSNQNLSDALNEYQSKEDELLGQTTDKIENFQFDNPFIKFVAPLQDVAYMLNGIYISLGSFNIPIGFSLTLTIALLCIGWYRFRGGG